MAPKKTKKDAPKEPEAPLVSPRTRLQEQLKSEAENTKFNRLRVLEKYSFNLSVLFGNVAC